MSPVLAAEISEIHVFVEILTVLPTPIQCLCIQYIYSGTPFTSAGAQTRIHPER